MADQPTEEHDTVVPVSSTGAEQAASPEVAESTAPVEASSTESPASEVVPAEEEASSAPQSELEKAVRKNTPTVVSGDMVGDPSSGEFHKKASSIKKGREIIKVEEKDIKLTTRLADLIVPFASLGVLVLIIVFVFIPFGTEILETRDQTRALADETRRNEAKAATVRSIDVSALDRTLKSVSQVVKDSMDVSELAIEVETLALDNNLSPRKQSVSDTEDVVSSSSKASNGEWVPSYTSAISGPFSYMGSFDDVTSFLNDLRNNSRTIMSLGAVSLTSRYDEDLDKEVWNVDLLISGYTAEPVQTVSIAEPISATVDETAVQEILLRTSDSGSTGESANSSDTGGNRE